MNIVLRVFFLAFAIAAALVAIADSVTHTGKLGVEKPWARATASMARNGAAYMTLTNQGHEIDRLITITTPIAKKAELHTSLMVNNIMKMRRMEALEVHPGKPAILKPGGMHIMLMGLKGPFRKGETFPLTLTFEKAGSIDVRVTVEGIATMRPGHVHGESPSPGHAKHGNHADAGKADRTFEMTIKDGKLAHGNSVIRVTQGQTVRLEWNSDEATTIHLHGYDIKTPVTPGATATMAFKAHATGRFAANAHGLGEHSSHRAEHANHGGGKETILFYLEVHPR